MALLNRVIINVASGGTADFIETTAVTGYQKVEDAGGIDGGIYHYAAQSSDLTQWEDGQGTWHAGTKTLARTTILDNSSGTGTNNGGAGTKINFSAAPQVMIAVLKESLRTILTAHTVVYYSPIGSDSNPGTLAEPWATPQHAQNVIAGYDLNGWVLDVQGADGTYGGPRMDAYPVGRGLVRWLGNASDNTKVTWDDTNTTFTCCEIDQYGAFLEFDNITFAPSVFSAIEVDANDSLIYVDKCNFVGSANFLPAIFINTSQVAFYLGYSDGFAMPDGSFIGGTADGNVIRGTWGEYVFIDADDSNVFLRGAHTLISTPSFGDAFLSASGSYDAFFLDNSNTAVSFTGSATGNRINLAGADSIADPGNRGLSFIPGSTQGPASPAAVYNGSAIPTTVSGLPTASSFQGSRMFVTDSNATLAAGLGNIVAGGGANKVPVYSDGTNWRIG